MRKSRRKNKKLKEEKADENMDEMNMRMFRLVKDKLMEIESTVHQHDEMIDMLISKSENIPLENTVDKSVPIATDPSLCHHYDNVCKEVDEKLK